MVSSSTLSPRIRSFSRIQRLSVQGFLMILSMVATVPMASDMVRWSSRRGMSVDRLLSVQISQEYVLVMSAMAESGWSYSGESHRMRESRLSGGILMIRSQHARRQSHDSNRIVISISISHTIGIIRRPIVMDSSHSVNHLDSVVSERHTASSEWEEAIVAWVREVSRASSLLSIGVRSMHSTEGFSQFSRQRMPENTVTHSCMMAIYVDQHSQLNGTTRRAYSWIWMSIWRWISSKDCMDMAYTSCEKDSLQREFVYICHIYLRKNKIFLI